MTDSIFPSSYESESPSSTDYLDVGRCEVILQNPEGVIVSPSELASILFRLSSRKPQPKIEFWIKITQ